MPRNSQSFLLSNLYLVWKTLLELLSEIGLPTVSLQIQFWSPAFRKRQCTGSWMESQSSLTVSERTGTGKQPSKAALRKQFVS